MPLHHEQCHEVKEFCLFFGSNLSVSTEKKDRSNPRSRHNGIACASGGVHQMMARPTRRRHSYDVSSQLTWGDRIVTPTVF